ncbi:MAG: thioredoxin domain-containing protein [Patescibacteria group bacterium]
MLPSDQKNGGIAFVGMIIVVIFIVFLGANVKDLLPRGTKNPAQSDMTRAEKTSGGKYTLSPKSVTRLSQSDFAFYVGSPNPRVKIVEFLDFQCPYCKRVLPTIQELMKRYTDAPVRFSFRHFPVESIHPAAFQASHASLCAKEQNKFMEYHDLLYEYQDIISEERLPVFAAGLGLDMDRFTTCMGTQRYASTIRKDLSDATTLGVVGTPTFFINGNRLEGALPIENFTRVIDEELARPDGR